MVTQQSTRVTDGLETNFKVSLDIYLYIYIYSRYTIAASQMTA